VNDSKHPQRLRPQAHPLHQQLHLYHPTTPPLSTAWAALLSHLTLQAISHTISPQLTLHCLHPSTPVPIHFHPLPHSHSHTLNPPRLMLLKMSPRLRSSPSRLMWRRAACCCTGVLRAARTTRAAGGCLTTTAGLMARSSTRTGRCRHPSGQQGDRPREGGGVRALGGGLSSEAAEGQGRGQARGAGKRGRSWGKEQRGGGGHKVQEWESLLLAGLVMLTCGERYWRVQLTRHSPKANTSGGGQLWGCRVVLHLL